MQTASDAENLAKPFLEFPCRLWKYLLGLQFEVDLKALEETMEQLKQHRNEVERQVIIAEGRSWKRTDAVKGWLKNVASAEKDVNFLVEEGSLLLDRCCCLGCCCPCSWWTRELFIKKLKGKIERVRELQSRGNFPVLVESRNQPETYDGPTQGLELIFADAWKNLEDDGAGILGLYGMPGVGKTTLLSKIGEEYSRNNTQMNTSAHPIVIRVNVSDEVDPLRIQNEIKERLLLSWPENSDIRQLLSWPENSDIGLRAEYIKKALTKIRFVLLLDDIRNKFDLSTIGVPPPEDSKNRSKIVFTTRSEVVCTKMTKNKKIVNCLDFDNSWKLFKQIVGEETLGSHRDIPGLAETVVKECGGLPLMLILVARTMATKVTPQAWEHAITQIGNSAAEFTQMGDEIFPFSKFSYDALPNDSVKACFLFCSLYPQKSIPVEDLIQKWIGKGYIDGGFTDWVAAVNAGYHVIGILKETCLLEHFDGYVKMHDFIRELALWISRECDEDKDKVLVNTGSGVRHAPEAEKWKEAGIISLTHTEITRLSDAPECPKLSTLLLFDNVHIKDIHDEFFRLMPALSFLDLSRIGTTRLPASIYKLVSLEYLDLSGTRIDGLHCDMKKFTRLKYLFLEHKDKVSRIPRGVMKGLRNLQMLKLSDSYFGDRPDDKLAGIQELLGLEKLKVLDLQISDVRVLEHFFSSSELVRCTRSLFIKLDPSHSKVIKLIPAPPPPPLSPPLPQPQSQVMEPLIVYCPDNNNDKEIRLFRCLETMHLRHLNDFIVSCDVLNSPSFKRLRCVTLSNCDTMVNVTWLILVPYLQTLEIDSCRGLIEIVSANTGGWEESTFLDLKTLILRDLPNLRSICANELLFPRLKDIKVNQCPNLRRLPLGSKNDGKHKLQSIQGTAQWWANLLWDNNLASTFVHYFSSIP